MPPAWPLGGPVGQPVDGDAPSVGSVLVVGPTVGDAPEVGPVVGDGVGLAEPGRLGVVVTLAVADGPTGDGASVPSGPTGRLRVGADGPRCAPPRPSAPAPPAPGSPPGPGARPP